MLSRNDSYKYQKQHFLSIQYKRFTYLLASHMHIHINMPALKREPRLLTREKKMITWIT